MYKSEIRPSQIKKLMDKARKLNYDKYHELIENVVIEGKKLSDLAEIKKSFMYDYILVKIHTESSLIDDS